jgi:hypothetical protein
MWHRVDLVRTDILEELIASIFRAPTCSHWFLVHGFLYPEDGSDIFLQNIGSHKIYVVPHPRRWYSSLIRDFLTF